MDVVRRDARAAEMRGEGKSWGQIAEELGLAKSSVRRAAQRARAEVCRVPVAKMIEYEEGVLNEAEKKLRWIMENPGPLITGGKAIPGTVDVDRITRAADALKRVSESRRKLYGTDEPAKSAIDVRRSSEWDDKINTMIPLMLYQAQAQALAAGRITVTLPPGVLPPAMALPAASVWEPDPDDDDPDDGGGVVIE